ncbi:sensor histidine kinase [Actinacidiphila acidipaludis]|uniref:histidine kinase n=1 Tax=Actinacidiphila acidipaludis TaxID=2873382 RepID=A0ABS7Q3L3_9ACTN|nr:histidine kinase [Streptomyces acidipaludis]MBY8877722.1 sensor histidine kinase [Streptomyces acidipaludis]
MRDATIAGTVFLAEAAQALLLPEGDVSHRPDALGWLLLAGSAAVLLWRRRAPMWCLLGMVACVAPYHYLQYVQQAPILSSMVALYALAVAGPPRRTFLVVPTVVLAMASVMLAIGKPDAGTEMLQSAGWIVAVAVAGEVVRIHRNYVAAITERAERAERTREEEAARRVAEERLRIARDLHDLLAHSITLIGVQTSVAAHILVADPERLDRAAVASALDAIADTCREARAELRTTLRVLRADGDGPLPDLAGLPSLARAAEAAGAQVALTVDTGTQPVPPAVGAAAYRIVQESLTNAVRHAGPADPHVTVTIGVSGEGGGLRLEITDDGGRPPRVPAQRPQQVPGAAPHETSAGISSGAGPRGDRAEPEPVPSGPEDSERPPAGGRPAGYGIAGMRERARSVGGSLTAGPRADAPGFAVTADLPFTTDTHGEPR